ncbi:tRNA 2-thiocytidine biosynthesis protein TtcA [uncultured archaeon]|nr:tRNA 2-thiocytidine biosynthesis protein TtcA [uncultured archaeon]
MIMKTIPCSSCKKPSSVRLAYAARHLCSGCFVKYFEKRFLRTVREFSMIRPRERIAVGLSGGKDSVVLLHLLSKLRKKMPFELVAVAIDEGIKGYRPATLKVAKRECRKLKIPLKVLTFKDDAGFSLDEIMKKANSAACSWCGVFRRYLLNRGARLVKADKLAIGHNLDDVAQTALMNMMRNEPMRLARFLEPIAEDAHFIPRIRPLMRTPEKEVAIYAMLRGIQITYSECPYAHFSFRQHVKKQLNDTEEKYPGTKQRILGSFLEMEKMMRKGMKEEKFEILHCEKCGEPSSEQVCMHCKMVKELKR